jgi:hypothetical protein
VTPSYQIIEFSVLEPMHGKGRGRSELTWREDSVSPALKGPHTSSVLYTNLTCAFQTCTATTEQTWTNSRNIHFSFADCMISGLSTYNCAA